MSPFKERSSDMLKSTGNLEGINRQVRQILNFFIEFIKENGNILLDLRIDREKRMNGMIIEDTIFVN